MTFNSVMLIQSHSNKIHLTALLLKHFLQYSYHYHHANQMMYTYYGGRCVIGTKWTTA